ncbi:MAG: glycine oxidase ThiO [Cyanobacteria bacterium]|nr:glycine oxidase ThiO [Cyanobacteriota bacterium]
MGSEEVLIVGGGVMGLSIALALKQKGMTARVVCRNPQEAASLAAAGMLAPQAEGLSAGSMRDLCIQSRDLYPTWVKDLETIGQCSTGYWASGILSPALNGPEASPFNHDRNQWADVSKMRAIQPTLSDEVQGGWWFPEDAQVDNRKLYRALRAAARVQNIPIQIATVTKFIHTGDRITSLMTTDGELQAQHYVLATGAWSEELLPIPVKPRKGQMLAVTMPMEDGLPVRTVLFGEDIYLVPRQDGRLVIGATSEDVGFLPGNTPSGIMQLLQGATRLIPAIAKWPIEEFWYGYRPVTPDDLPILGESQYRNLTYATGHGRNGILLTPITGKLIADWITTQTNNPLLAAFHWSRLIA